MQQRTFIQLYFKVEKSEKEDFDGSFSILAREVETEMKNNPSVSIYITLLLFSELTNNFFGHNFYSVFF